MQAVPATINTTEDGLRSTEENIVAAPTKNGVRSAEENSSNVATPVQTEESLLNQVRNELEQFI